MKNLKEFKTKSKKKLSKKNQKEKIKGMKWKLNKKNQSQKNKWHIDAKKTKANCRPETYTPDTWEYLAQKAYIAYRVSKCRP